MRDEFLLHFQQLSNEHADLKAKLELKQTAQQIIADLKKTVVLLETRCMKLETELALKSTIQPHVDVEYLVQSQIRDIEYSLMTKHEDEVSKLKELIREL